MERDEAAPRRQGEVQEDVDCKMYNQARRQLVRRMGSATGRAGGALPP